MKQPHAQETFLLVNNIHNQAQNHSLKSMPNLMSKPVYQEMSNSLKQPQNTLQLVQIKNKIQNAILEPQQPENYLNDLQQLKQASLISIKSQPLNATRCKKSAHNLNHEKQSSLSRKMIRLRQNQSSKNLSIENDNKKTRKFLTRPNQQQVNANVVQQLMDQHYRFDGNKCLLSPNMTKNTNFGNGSIANRENNEKTLRIGKCAHKDNAKTSRLCQQVRSLQNLDSRLKMCQAYIQLSQKRHNLLLKEVQFLMTKEYKRHENKIKRKHDKCNKNVNEQDSLKMNDMIENRSLRDIQQHNEIIKDNQRHKHHHKESKVEAKNSSTVDQNSLNNISSHIHTSWNSPSKQRTRKQHSKLHVKNGEEEYDFSRSRFHFRSTDKKESKMRKLIYYRGQQETFDGIPHDKKKTEGVSFFDHNGKHYRNDEQNSHIRNSHNKKQDKYDKQNQSYLLLEQQDEQPQKYSNYQNNHHHVPNNTSQKSVIRPQNQTSSYHHPNIPFVNSQPEGKNISKSHHHIENYSNLKNPSRQSQIRHEYMNNEVYLTKEFCVDEFNSINENRNSEMSVQSSRSLKSSKSSSRQVGRFKFVQQPSRQPQDMKADIPSNSSQQFTQSNQSSTQPQYTFINHNNSNHQRRPNPTYQYEVIQSNMNTPLVKQSHNNESSQQEQTLLINQFDSLVIAAADEQIPTKKQLLREQIHKTSQSIHQLNSNKNIAGKNYHNTVK